MRLNWGLGISYHRSVGLRLRRGCLVGLGVGVILGVFVGAIHMDGLVLCGGGMIHGVLCWRQVYVWR
jgi:hypothetical protein